MTNQGTITVQADAVASAYANTHVIYRYPTSTSTAYGSASAQGIAGGGGDNLIANGGVLNVTATARKFGTTREKVRYRIQKYRLKLPR